MSRDGSGAARDDAVSALRYGWGDAYEIGHADGHGYWARRRDGLGGLITGPDPEALWSKILEDYNLKHVPRDLPELDAGASR